MPNKHTPGPWSVKLEHYGYLLKTNSNGGWLFELSDNRHHSGGDESFLNEQDANANLISAAPDLLGVIDALISHEDNPDFTQWNRIIESARTVSAKAKGESDASQDD